MPFRDPLIPLQDIAEAIEMIERFTHGMDFEAFRADAKTVAAVERKLQVISEAAIRLVTGPKRYVPIYRGPTFAESAIGSGMSMSAWSLKSSGRR